MNRKDIFEYALRMLRTIEHLPARHQVEVMAVAQAWLGVEINRSSQPRIRAPVDEGDPS